MIEGGVYLTQCRGGASRWMTQACGALHKRQGHLRPWMASKSHSLTTLHTECVAPTVPALSGGSVLALHHMRLKLSLFPLSSRQSWPHLAEVHCKLPDAINQALHQGFGPDPQSRLLHALQPQRQQTGCCVSRASFDFPPVVNQPKALQGSRHACPCGWRRSANPLINAHRCHSLAWPGLLPQPLPGRQPTRDS